MLEILVWRELYKYIIIYATSLTEQKYVTRTGLTETVPRFANQGVAHIIRVTMKLEENFALITGTVKIAQPTASHEMTLVGIMNVMYIVGSKFALNTGMAETVLNIVRLELILVDIMFVILLVGRGFV